MSLAVATSTDMASKAKKPRVPSESKKSVRTGRAVTAWLDSDLWAAFDRYIQSLDPTPSNTAALESALRHFLREKGFWPPAD